MAITRRTAIAIAKIEKSTPPQKNSIKEEKAQISRPEPVIAEALPSEYEQIREQRIKENKERLEKLGVVNLCLQLKATTPKPSKRKWEKKIHSGPRRRSSRLQGETPVDSTNVWAYIEPKKRKKCEPKKKEKKEYELKKEVKKKYVPKKKQKKPREKKMQVCEIEDEWPNREEVYTEEHEKLLGDTNKEWTLCVDGYGPNGARIYDPVNGKTCHQCRQKTLGLRTHCSKCNLVQGQFCGDCLYMRYGEHVEEANENPDWVCPPCRGICNCSLCRQAKGWLPTGALYRKIKRLGFKSVAHYLIMTKCAPNSEKTAKKPQSVRRSLPFEGMEVDSDSWSEQELNIDGKCTAPNSEKTAKMPQSVKGSPPFKSMEVDSGNRSEQELKIDGKSGDMGRLKERSKKETGDQKEQPVVTNAANPNEDSIARRLRSRSRT